MTYLLDTNTLLWALTEPTQLGLRAAMLIDDRVISLVVSAASAWAIATKHRIGRLPQADALIGGYANHLDQLGLRDAAVRDPAGKMIRIQQTPKGTN